jgi:hypothetical protein
VQLGQVQAARVMKFTTAKEMATKAATIKAYVRAAVAAAKAATTRSYHSLSQSIFFLRPVTPIRSFRHSKTTESGQSHHVGASPLEIRISGRPTPRFSTHTSTPIRAMMTDILAPSLQCFQGVHRHIDGLRVKRSEAELLRR